jgi:hypothetical protein
MCQNYQMQHTLNLPPVTKDEIERFNRAQAEQRARRRQLSLCLEGGSLRPLRMVLPHRRQDRCDLD